MSKFRIEVRFTGITVEEARETLDSLVLKRHETVDGFWNVLEDETTDKAIVHGKVVWDGKAVSKFKYAGRIISPLVDKRGIQEVTDVLNRLYADGAVVMSVDCVKIHFLGRFSQRKARAILKKLVWHNKLLYTVLFFPRLLAPLWTPDREEKQDDTMETFVYYAYKEILDKSCWNVTSVKLLSGVVCDLLKWHTKVIARESEGKMRFDSDSSPDSRISRDARDSASDE